MLDNHTTPEIWAKYRHLISLDNIPNQAVPNEVKMLHAGKDSMVHSGTSSIMTKDHGIPQESLQKLVHPYAFPLMADTLKNLPPAYIYTSALDPLQNDGILFANLLRRDGVKVVHHQNMDSLHGIFVFPKPPLGLEAGERLIMEIARFIKTV